MRDCICMQVTTTTTACNCGLLASWVQAVAALCTVVMCRLMYIEWSLLERLTASSPALSILAITSARVYSVLCVYLTQHKADPRLKSCARSVNHRLLCVQRLVCTSTFTGCISTVVRYNAAPSLQRATVCTQCLLILLESEKNIWCQSIITSRVRLGNHDFKWAFPFSFTVLRNWTICSNEMQQKFMLVRFFFGSTKNV